MSLLLEVDEQVTSLLEGGEAVEMVEQRPLCVEHALGPVGDDDSDEVVLVGQVVIRREALTSVARRTPSMPVCATPWAKTSSAAASTIRARVARYLAVSFR